MLLNILMIVGGVALVLWGADRLTDGAVAIASRMGLPQIIIGLTIVAMGTSMPEFCVSMVSAVNGTTAMAVGNVIGSNIFNSMLIVGIAAMITPIAILSSTVRKDIPFALMASAVLVVMCVDGDVSRWDALVLVGLFAVFMFMTLQGAKVEKRESSDDGQGTSVEDEKHKTPMSPWMAVAWMLIGLVCLVGGSEVFVRGASAVAKAWGISDAVVGLTVVAMGTSLPELATTAVSARKGDSGIAIGNVLGSNVFNLLMVLGVTGVICPMGIEGITRIDLTLLVGSMVLLWLFSYTKLIIQRWEGTLLTVLFAGYLTWLVYSA